MRTIPEPIIAVLKSYGAEVPLSATGAGRKRWLSMLCPFHGDGQASAAVNVEAGRFMCHGCMFKAEDAIGLIQWHEEISYRDAKRRCEDITGGSGESVRGPSKRGLRDLSP